MGDILITGGTGFMGSHLVRSVIDMPEFKDSLVTVLDDLSGGFRENVPNNPRIDFIVGSITDADLVSRLFDERKYDYVFHLAAYAAVGLQPLHSPVRLHQQSLRKRESYQRAREIQRGLPPSWSSQ